MPANILSVPKVPPSSIHQFPATTVLFTCTEVGLCGIGCRVFPCPLVRIVFGDVDTLPPVTSADVLPFPSLLQQYLPFSLLRCWVSKCAPVRNLQSFALLPCVSFLEWSMLCERPRRTGGHRSPAAEGGAPAPPHRRTRRIPRRRSGRRHPSRATTRAVHPLGEKEEEGVAAGCPQGARRLAELFSLPNVGLNGCSCPVKTRGVCDLLFLCVLPEEGRRGGGLKEVVEG